MAKECVAYLKDKIDMSAMLSRLNAALAEEWRSYARLVAAYEAMLAHRRRTPDADDADYLARTVLC
ncbi:MAG: hypothetical protein K2L76_00855 [Muribaculaceae bacterium]|nr:hypothetical protein [Muribaculaceae bacterium]